MSYADREVRLAYYRRRYAENRDVLRAQQRVYESKHREETKRRAVAWNKANPERRAVIAKRHLDRAYVADPERFRAYARKWAKAHPEVGRARAGLRRASGRGACPRWVDRDALFAFYAEAKRLDLTVDHIVPLKHPLVCGLHVPWNLQLLTRSENSKKKNHFEPFSGPYLHP